MFELESLCSSCTSSCCSKWCTRFRTRHVRAARSQASVLLVCNLFTSAAQPHTSARALGTHRAQPRKNLVHHPVRVECRVALGRRLPIHGNNIRGQIRVVLSCNDPGSVSCSAGLPAGGGVRRPGGASEGWDVTWRRKAPPRHHRSWATPTHICQTLSIVTVCTLSLGLVFSVHVSS